MKKILLATSALAMTASFAAAEVSVSGAGGAGVISVATAGTGNTTAKSHCMGWYRSTILVRLVTTDSGITLGVSEDIGGGDLADYADKEINVRATRWVMPNGYRRIRRRPLSQSKKMELMTFTMTITHGDIGIATSLGWSKRWR